jgi:hypothetical protein
MRVGNRSRRRRAALRRNAPHRDTNAATSQSNIFRNTFFLLALCALGFTVHQSYYKAIDNSTVGNLDAAVEILHEESKKLEDKMVATKRFRGSPSIEEPWELWNVSENNGLQIRAHIYKKGYEPGHVIDGDPSTFWVSFSYPSIVDFILVDNRIDKQMFNAYEIAGHPEKGLYGQSPSSWVLFGSHTGLPPWHLLDEVSRTSNIIELFSTH